MAHAAGAAASMPQVAYAGAPPPAPSEAQLSLPQLSAVKARLQSLLGPRAPEYFALVTALLRGQLSPEALEQRAPALVGEANMRLHLLLVSGCVQRARAQRAAAAAAALPDGATFTAARASAQAPAAAPGRHPVADAGPPGWGAPHGAGGGATSAAHWQLVAAPPGAPSGAALEAAARAAAAARASGEQRGWGGAVALAPLAPAHGQQQQQQVSASSAMAAAAQLRGGVDGAGGRHAALSPAAPSPRAGVPRVPSDSPPLKRGIEAVDTAASAPAQGAKRPVPATVLGAPLLPGHWRDDLPDALAAGLRLQAAAEAAGVPRVERAAARLAAAAVGAHLRAVLLHAARLPAVGAHLRAGLSLEALLEASLAADSPLRGERHRVAERLRVLVATQPQPHARAAATAALHRPPLPLPLPLPPQAACLKDEVAEPLAVVAAVSPDSGTVATKAQAPPHAQCTAMEEETAEAPTPEELPPGFLAPVQCR